MSGMSVAWNWKSAVVSAVCRAAIFFAFNLSAGMDAALGALKVEFVFRLIASGFFGALTQSFARMRNVQRATWLALLVLPSLAHLLEFLLHSWAGTPVLGWSIIGSVSFSVITTRFHLIAMRRNILTVGAGSRSLQQDLAALPGAVVAFFRLS
jgi:hypothetical protein